MATNTAPRRAIGIVRCSPDEKNSDKHSPEVQRQTIRDYCAEKGWELLDILEEIDVSGRWALERRAGLASAVESVEAGEADVIVVARFDRMVRSTAVQAEITKRVEQAGGDLFAIDHGSITNGNATARMSATFLGAVAQFHSDTTRERSAEGVQRAIDNGIPPFGGATAGYDRPVIGVRGNGKPIYGPLVVNEREKPVVQEAWQRRADGATISECRAFLAEHGIDYSYPGVIKLFTSKLPLGELHHGKFRPNLHAHDPIIDRDLWEQVQRVRTTRGRQAKSQRLLSRLGVLRCAGCNGRMSIGDDWRGLKVYRCSTSHGACPERSTITADVAEETVWARAVHEGRIERGRASSTEDARAAAAEADAADTALEGLVAMLTGLEDVGNARERLLEAQAEAKRLRARADRLEAAGSAVTVDVDDPALTLEERRAVIRATIESATVARSWGRGVTGAERITIKAFGEDAPGGAVEHAA